MKVFPLIALIILSICLTLKVLHHETVGAVLDSFAMAYFFYRCQKNMSQ